jgi:hypothetical protein
VDIALKDVFSNLVGITCVKDAFVVTHLEFFDGTYSVKCKLC